MQLRRGFHRIGMAGFVPLCVLAVPLFVFAAYSWLTAPPWVYSVVGPDYQQFEFPGWTSYQEMERVLSRQYGRPISFGYGDGKIPYPSSRGYQAREAAMASGAIGLGALVVGGLWYLACWTVAWIIAGFRNE
jgi:hypothetical protein